MGVKVAFNYAGWVARYPNFATVSEAAADQYFAEATIYHRNDGGGPVSSAAIQTVLLNMMTAHIAARYSNADGSTQDANTPVGRLSNATEGSVTAAFQNDYPPGTAQWYQQTKYGSDYWLATAVYRTMRYRAAPLCSPGVFNGAFGGAWVYPNGN